MATNEEPDYSGILTFEEIAQRLRRKGKSELKNIIDNYGPLTARVVMLRIALEDKLAQPYLRNYPPSIFIAYKWENEEHQAWVRSLAAHLKGNGYRVLLDQDHLEKDASNFDEVPRYIAGMVGCDFFLVVLTERYLDMVEVRGQKTTWVFDEYQAAVKLHNYGRIRMCSVLKDPRALPESLLLRLNAIDLRGEPTGLALLDPVFPKYTGRSLNSSEHERLVNFVSDYDGLCQSAEIDLYALRNLLEDNAEFSDLYDFKFRLAQLFWLAGAVDKAYPIAFEIREGCCNDDHIMLLAQIFDSAADYPTLFRFLYLCRRNFNLRDSVMYHYFAAETLFELNSVFAARNHFCWLTRSPGFSSFPPNIQDTISARYHDLNLRIQEITPEHSFLCTTCGSRYIHVAEFRKVCGDCGTLYEATEAACPVCSNTGLIPLQMLVEMFPDRVAIECPICNEGTMHVAGRSSR